MAIFMDIKGSSVESFQLGKGGPKFKVSSGALQARNAADDAFVDFHAQDLYLGGNTLVLNNDASEAAADWKYTIVAPAAGMTANVTLNLPVNDGDSGQFLTTDGSGNTSWGNPSASGAMTVETTDLVFGSAAELSLFTLPANAMVLEVEVIVDEIWDDTATLEIGLTGSLGKYMATTDNDIENCSAKDSYRASKNEIPVGATEDLIATYVAGGTETTGAARIIVKYVIPA